MWNLKLLFAEYAKEINRFLRKRGHQPEVAADLTQEVFLKMLSVTSPVNDDNPRAYLHQVARNLSIDLFRREQIIETVDLQDDELENIQDGAPGPEKITYDREQLAQVDAVMAQLPEKTRRAFELYRLGDMTIREVADEIDMSVSRTWTLIRAAYLSLEQHMDHES
jgi:RNA polymerase sigma factor (sigma-70 family)